MKTILLTHGEECYIDDRDYKKVSSSKWCKDNTGYAVANRGNRKVYMHRLILEAQKGELIDHINRNKLDNQRSNLRLCTHSQNHANENKMRNNKSGYKGVSWAKREKRWRAVIQKDGIYFGLGYYKDKKEAALAYDNAAKTFFGEFSLLNFQE